MKINIIDTPGHADFGGEVERVVRMADGALVLIDAAEGPMPQTRFVLSKALEVGVKPIVVINKIDRPDARAAEVLDEALELLVDLGGEHYMDHFLHIYSSSKEGYATHDPTVRGDSMVPLLDMVLESIPGPEVEPDAPLQMLVTNLDWSEYVGRIAVGRIQAGKLKVGQQIDVPKGMTASFKLKYRLCLRSTSSGRVEVDEVTAGDIAAVVGLDDVEIGDTICTRGELRPLPRLTVDEPTLEMIFSVNTSGFAGREGKYVTTRQFARRSRRSLNVTLPCV